MITNDNFAKGMAEWNESFNYTTRKWDELHLSQFSKYLHGEVLEIGGGWGRITSLVAEQNTCKKLTVTEPSSLFYSQLKKNLSQYQNLTILNSQIEDLQSSKKNKYDVVYSVHVFVHFENDKAFFDLSLELVKPNGYLVVSVPALQFLYSELDKEIGHFRRYDKNSLKKLAYGTNSKIIKLNYSDFIGVFGSFIASKIGKTNYKNSQKEKSNFNKLASFYSNYFIPITNLIEKILPPPIGLNITLIIQKNAQNL